MQSLLGCPLQQMLLTLHYLLLLTNHTLLCIQLVLVFRFLNLQSLFGDSFTLVKNLNSRCGCDSCLLDLCVLLGQYLLLLIEHGRWLVRLSELVEECRLLLPDLIIGPHLMLPLQILNQLVVMVRLVCLPVVHVILLGRERFLTWDSGMLDLRWCLKNLCRLRHERCFFGSGLFPTHLNCIVLDDHVRVYVFLDFNNPLRYNSLYELLHAHCHSGCIGYIWMLPL